MTTDAEVLTPGSVERWAADYILSTDLSHKLAPPRPPSRWLDPPPAPVQHRSPGRPPELDVRGKSRRSIPAARMGNPARRAELLHTFLHHELQAAELMCQALLAFPDTPRSFRQGLLGICQDEIRHMGLYREHLLRLDHAVGAFPVRDWFWQRVSSCTTPLQFVALMGMGLEGGNLDHTRRFAELFETAGDTDGARLQRVVGDEEVGHVQFAVQWFQTWTGGLDFDRWRLELIEPLTPTMMKGASLDMKRRRQAGFTDEFLESLRQWDTG